MQNAFMIIIALFGAIYALFHKETKMALGFLVIAVAFVLQISSLATGFWSDILVALSLIVFAVGVFVIVSLKKIGVKADLKDENKNKQ